MDKAEARHLLLENLRPYLRWPYDRLRELVGGEHVVTVEGGSGTRCFFEVYVSPIIEGESELEVEGFVSEVEGRRWLPPLVNGSFVVRPDGQVFTRAEELKPDA